MAGTRRDHSEFELEYLGRTCYSSGASLDCTDSRQTAGIAALGFGVSELLKWRSEQRRSNEGFWFYSLEIIISGELDEGSNENRYDRGQYAE